MAAIGALARRAASLGRDFAHRALATAGLRQSEATISRDASEYWEDAGSESWKANSHWRDAPVFAGNDLWHEIGARHLTMLQRGARMVQFDRPWKRVVEWGCGGGANAVHFAPQCDEYVGVDVARASLDESAKQVAASCSTPFIPVRVDVENPEQALALIGGPCEVFLSCYVFELIPTPAYGARLLRIARDLLVPGGLALIQIKYDDGRWRSKSRRRSYKTGIAAMTTYRIPDFWQLAEDIGLTPEAIELVPENELDKRYAYFLLSKPF
ncbi:class I SAM-dependent methyltransferase [Amycolatopsis sp. NPDC006131]|uniref:class I SAM-dependent methyltransferase n=1 Tax=Amycolatopsis sp. NPDC006131 TaxID=3156731 RepID=UPI0033A224F9